MVVDKQSLIGLKEEEIRVDFIIEVINMLIKLKNKAFSQAEYNKVNEIAEIISKEFYEMRDILIKVKSE